jgi:glycogen debranching enzyme
VWSWLIGPFIEAHLRVNGFSPDARREGRQLLQPLLDQMGEAGIGSVSEIFDGDSPHAPGGCPAQAWSVAELIRVWDLLQCEGAEPAP